MLRLLIMTLPWVQLVRAQDENGSNWLTNPPIVLTVEGTNVWIQQHRSNAWESAYPNQILKVKDRGRTGADSRTVIRLSDLSVLRIGWHSEFEIQPLPEPDVEAEFNLLHGLLRLLNRDRPGKHRFVTPTATAATRGTEFVLEVEEGTGHTVLTVFEGEAELTNALGSVRLESGEQGMVNRGQAPTKTAIIDATAIVQWCLYYPGVLDPAELVLSEGEEAALSVSLTSYRRGDLLAALSAYPSGRIPTSDYERIYLAALLLSVGHVEQSESLLSSLNETDPQARVRRLADAMRLVVDTVTLRHPHSNFSSQPAPALATEFLAESYYRQSQFELSESLALARRCVELAPDFGFGWERVAELEFSHGRLSSALDALETSVALAPRNAQAFALRGFLLSAQNRIREASKSFEQAMTIDGGLGNAWLGRGLCLIRQGKADAGRFDLQVAAAVEPQRSELRSYLGKAFSNTRDSRHAENELRIASELDPNDPTPWLYSALLLRQLNRNNEAVHDLERSKELNDNRRVYRSRLLLDQDLAVRSANQALVYRDAGLADLSVREAARAVNTDYANYSAHLFLANSYNDLRDWDQADLRYETAWFTEYLLANLLAPVGGGTLSQNVSQQEYSKLFEQDGPGLSSTTDYLSSGEWFQDTTIHGTHRNSAYAAEVTYHSDDGQRPNNDLEQLAIDLTWRQQLTPQDSVLLRGHYYDADAGDVRRYYSQTQANTTLRVQEQHDPWLLAGYDHEWAPGSHTLALAGWLQGTFQSDTSEYSVPYFNHGFGGPVLLAAPITFEQEYDTGLELFTAEAQQILQLNANTLVVGARFQAGQFDTHDTLTNAVLYDGSPVTFAVDTDTTTDLQRISAYLYDQWQVHPAWLLIAGVVYDHVVFPQDFRYAPVTPGEETRDQVSPKVGLIWTPARNTTVRGAYTRGLGGVSLDQSVRLEPSQVAGFNQVFRSLIPESVVGPNSVPTFETAAVSLEQKFGRGTYIAVTGELLSSDVDRTVGVVDFTVPPVLGPGFSSGTTQEELNYLEQNLTVAVNQLLGDKWALGARYRISHAKLDELFPDVPPSAATEGGFQRQQNLQATLQQANAFVLYNHPCGFFARAGAIWTMQSNQGYTPDIPGDNFWQFNLDAGYRFARRRAELRLGLLNLTDQDYQLNPLNLTPELPRERTLAVSLQFNF